MVNADQDAVALRIQSILDGAPEGKKTEPRQDASDDSSSDEETARKSGDVRGKRPGNRFWKNDRKRFSSVIATRGLKLSFDLKEKLRSDLKHAKELSKSVKEERARIKQEKREKRKENIKRKEENARKSEIVQVIKNTSKLKRLKKKQLRTIEKRDTSGMV